jgi:hypothetical protein
MELQFLNFIKSYIITSSVEVVVIEDEIDGPQITFEYYYSLNNEGSSEIKEVIDRINYNYSLAEEFIKANKNKEQLSIFRADLKKTLNSIHDPDINVKTIDNYVPDEKLAKRLNEYNNTTPQALYDAIKESNALLERNTSFLHNQAYAHFIEKINRLIDLINIATHGIDSTKENPKPIIYKPFVIKEKYKAKYTEIKTDIIELLTRKGFVEDKDIPLLRNLLTDKPDKKVNNTREIVWQKSRNELQVAIKIIILSFFDHTEYGRLIERFIIDKKQKPFKKISSNYAETIAEKNYQWYEGLKSKYPDAKGLLNKIRE